MNKFDEINKLQETVNEMLVQQAILTQRSYAVESLLFEMISAYSPEDARAVFTNYVKLAEEQTIKALDDLEDVLLDPEPSFLLRKKVDFQSCMDLMKSHPLFQNRS